MLMMLFTRYCVVTIHVDEKVCATLEHRKKYKNTIKNLATRIWLGIYTVKNSKILAEVAVHPNELLFAKKIKKDV